MKNRSRPDAHLQEHDVQDRRAFLQMLMGGVALATLAGVAGCSDSTSSPDGSSSSSSSSSTSSSSSG